MTVYVVQSWHVEPNRFDGEKLYFKNEFVESLFKAVDPFHSHVFLLQADKSTQCVFNDINFVYNEYRDKWFEYINTGSQVGWHYHCYNSNLNGQEMDEKKALKDFYSYAPQISNRSSFSAGWCYLPKSIQRCLSEYVKLDFSALPGLYTPGKNVNGNIINNSDWKDFVSTSPTNLYDVLYIPVTMFGALQLKFNESPKWYTQLYRRLEHMKGDILVHGYAHSYDMIGLGLQNYQKHIEKLNSLKNNGVDVKFISPLDLPKKTVGVPLNRNDILYNLTNRVKNKFRSYD